MLRDWVGSPISDGLEKEDLPLKRKTMQGAKRVPYPKLSSVLPLETNSENTEQKQTNKRTKILLGLLVK